MVSYFYPRRSPSSAQPVRAPSGLALATVLAVTPMVPRRLESGERRFLPGWNPLVLSVAVTLPHPRHPPPALGFSLGGIDREAGPHAGALMLHLPRSFLALKGGRVNTFVELLRSVHFQL